MGEAAPAVAACRRSYAPERAAPAHVAHGPARRAEDPGRARDHRAARRPRGRHRQVGLACPRRRRLSRAWRRRARRPRRDDRPSGRLRRRRRGRGGCMTLEASRPVALAARLAGEPTAAFEHLFARRTVLIRLAPEVATSVPMREAALLAVNAILRFCPNVTLALPSAAMDVADSARELARAIHGDEAVLATCAIDQADVEPFDAVLGVGRDLRAHHAWIAVDASGWCARVATSASGANPLPPAHVPANELAALAAACLGVGQVFLALVGRPLLANPLELSLFDLT